MCHLQSVFSSDTVTANVLSVFVYCSQLFLVVTLLLLSIESVLEDTKPVIIEDVCFHCRWELIWQSILGVQQIQWIRNMSCMEQTIHYPAVSLNWTYSYKWQVSFTSTLFSEQLGTQLGFVPKACEITYVSLPILVISAQLDFCYQCYFNRLLWMCCGKVFWNIWLWLRTWLNFFFFFKYLYPISFHTHTSSRTQHVIAPHVSCHVFPWWEITLFPYANRWLLVSVSSRECNSTLLRRKFPVQHLVEHTWLLSLNFIALT